MSALSFNPNCGACGGLNSRGYCSYTACRFPVTKVTVITNQQTKTNADRIRAMSDEELAEMLRGSCPEDVEDCNKYIIPDSGGGRNCYKCWLDWLRQETPDA